MQQKLWQNMHRPETKIDENYMQKTKSVEINTQEYMENLWNRFVSTTNAICGLSVFAPQMALAVDTK
jgi:hypothetical protein